MAAFRLYYRITINPGSKSRTNSYHKRSIIYLCVDILFGNDRVYYDFRSESFYYFTLKSGRDRDHPS